MGEDYTREERYRGAVVALSKFLVSDRTNVERLFLATVQYFYSMQYPDFKGECTTDPTPYVLSKLGPPLLRLDLGPIVCARNIVAHDVESDRYYVEVIPMVDSCIRVAKSIITFESRVRVPGADVAKITTEFWGYERKFDEYNHISEDPCAEFRKIKAKDFKGYHTSKGLE